MWKFIRDHISIDEFKVSALVIAFMGLIALVVFMIVTTGDFSGNFLILLQTLIYAIAGVNGVKGIADIVGSRKSDSSSEVVVDQLEDVDNVVYGQGEQDEK